MSDILSLFFAYSFQKEGLYSSYVDAYLAYTQLTTPTSAPIKLHSPSKQRVPTTNPHRSTHQHNPLRPKVSHGIVVVVNRLVLGSTRIKHLSQHEHALDRPPEPGHHSSDPTTEEPNLRCRGRYPSHAPASPRRIGDCGRWTDPGPIFDERSSFFFFFVVVAFPHYGVYSLDQSDEYGWEWTRGQSLG